MEMIDLSRVIYDGMPKIPILPDVHVQKFLSLEKGHPLNVTELSLPCHAGTHVDAPIHIVANGKSIDELPVVAPDDPTRLIGLLSRRELVSAYSAQIEALRAPEPAATA